MREIPGDYDYNRFTEPFSCQISTSHQAGNVKFHMHTCHEIFLLLEGEIQYFVENACYPLNPGNVILFSNQEIHKAINIDSGTFTRLVIHVDPSFVRQYCTLQTNLLSCFHRVPGIGNLVFLSEDEKKALISMSQLLEKSLYGEKRYGSDLTAITTLIQILILINSAWQKTTQNQPAPKPHRAQALMNYIDQNLTEALSLDTIASALSMDKYYLSHLFKAETESSIFQYILVKRVALAKELLAKGHTVAETCHLSGFHDYSNFIRSFRQITGQTPGQFQKVNC